MSSKKLLRFGGVGRLFVFIHLVLVLITRVHGDTLVWDTDNGTAGAQDGAGTWTAGLGNWFNQTQTLQNQVWVNGSDAVFGNADGVAGTITLGGQISVGNLTFNAATSGTYTLSGSTLTLLNSTITSNVAATISSVLAGSTPWTKQGAGQLTLSGSGSNTLSGLLTVNAGVLFLNKSGGATAVAGDLTITSGGMVTFGTGTTNQIASTSNVIQNGATSVFNGTGPNVGNATVTQTLASLTISGGTFNAGTNSVWNIGAVSYVAGANKVFVGNSGSKQTFGSLSLVGMNGAASADTVANGFTLFGNGGSVANRTTLTIGAGGLSLNDSRIHLGSGSSGSELVLNGDVTTSGSASFIDREAGAGLLPYVSLSGTSGTVTRTFNIGATLTISPVIQNGAATTASLVKTGSGTLIFNGAEANTYTGDTIINAGTLTLGKTAGVAAVAGNIIVNTGGALQWNANNQIADTAGITLNGGTLPTFTRDETIAFFTQNAGGITSSNTGHMIITGALTLVGGNTLTINSSVSANPASWSAGSAFLSGADILVGGNNGSGNPRTSLTIGAGGLTMLGRTITLNVGNAGVVMNLNGDFTGISTNNILASGTSSVEPLLEIGAATRTFNIINGATTVSVIINGTGGSLVKTGRGLMQLTSASTYTGTTTVSGGTLSVAGTGGSMANTASLVIDNSGTLQIGSSTPSNNNGVSNRINTAATLTLGGGTVSVISAATGSIAQNLASLTLNDGANTVGVTTTAGTTNTLTFTGANPYVRTAGTVNFVQNTVDGGSIVFTNAPSGAGNVSGGLLVGATLNGTDLILAQSGVLTAFTGWIPTGTTTWTNNGAMDVTGSNPTAFPSETINALRFNTAGAFTITLNGTHTIDSGMLLVTPTVGANLSTITGGTLRGPAGGELVVTQYNTSGNLEIASVIADNTSATSLIKAGSGTLVLSGTNTYSGITQVNEGVLRAADGTGLSTSSALVLNGGVFQSTAATFNRALGTAAGQVALVGGTTGFSTAATALAVNLGGSGATVQWGSAAFDPGVLLLNTASATAALDFQNGIDLNGTTRTIRVEANTATISGVISNSASGSPAGIAKSGAGTLRLTQANTFDGGVTLSAGTLAVGNNAALGTGDLVLSGGTLQADGAARTLTNKVFISDSSAVSGSQTLTLAGDISGPGTFNKSGTSVVVLSGNNTYSGTTNVTSGILRLLSNTALGSTTGSTTVASGAAHVELGDGVVITGETITVSSPFGATGDGTPTSSRGGLQAAVNATAEWAGNVIIGANQGRIGVQEGGMLTVSGTITDGSNSFDVRLSGETTGTGGLLLSGAGNDWGGQTEIVRGKVFLGINNALPSNTVLDIHFSNTNNGEYAGVDMNGFNQSVSSLRNEGNSGTSAELTNSSRTLSTLTINETSAITYGGIITGNLALVKNGAGTTTLSNSNSFTGGVTVNEGVLQISNAGALANGNVTINGGATSAGKLDLNNTSTIINALNGAAGTVAALIANESTTAATRTLTVGVNHASGTYAGNIVDNSGGGAQGIVAFAKIGAGTQTLSGTNTYSGSTTISNGTLVADYAAGSPLSVNSTIVMNGGTLVISHAGTATIGAITEVQAGADFTTGVIRIQDAATITTGTFTVVGYTPFLIDLRGGGTLVATTLSGAANTNGVLIGTANNRATTYVQDDSGFGFATYNGSNQIVRYTAGTALTASNSSSATNFVLSSDLTRTAALGFQTLQIDTATNDVTLDMGANNFVVGSAGRAVLVTGSNDATITGSGAVTGGSFYLSNFSSGVTTFDVSLASQTLIVSGTGLINYTNAANPDDLYVTGGVLRMSGSDRDYSNNLLRIYGGGVLEIGADLNGTADGSFTRDAATSGAGKVALIGNGGFSAHGADRVVALGGTAAPTALTWGTSGFLSGPNAADNNYTFMLGSAYSTHTLEFQNAIALGSRERRIEVADGTNANNVDARLTGQLSDTGGIIKEGTGRLEFTAANTYSGDTQVNAGSLVIASGGSTGTGAVSVAANAALMGTGIVQGSSVTLANNAALHAGNGSSSTDMGTLTFQTSAQAVYDLQSGSSITLDIQNANNHGSIDPTFGGNAIGSTGYNAYVDAFSGLGTGAHDLLVFDAAAGSKLTFSGDLSVRPEGFTAAMGQVFNLLDWTSLVEADFTGFNVGTNFRDGASDDLSQFDLPTLTGGLLWDVSRFTTSGVIVVVPEPGRVLLLMFGMLLLGIRRRR